jgi:hypothetical protein
MHAFLQPHQAHASNALINFADHLEDDALQHHIDALMPALADQLAHGSRSERENSLTAIASVCERAGEKVWQAGS